MHYLTFEEIILIHDELCDSFQNRKGILSQGQLESLCAHIQNDTYYPDIFQKIAHLFFGLVQFHIFVDANKRTALSTVLLFIAANSDLFQDIDAGNSALFLEQLSLSVAIGKTRDTELPSIMRDFFGK